MVSFQNAALLIGHRVGILFISALILIEGKALRIVFILSIKIVALIKSVGVPNYKKISINYNWFLPIK